MPSAYWADRTTEDLAHLDPERTIAVLPIAAVEQHGPHLPVSTDTEIANGMVRETIARLPADLTALFLPTQQIGKSNEHIRSPGTLTLSAETAIRAWTEIGESVHRAGVKKLVMVNSHGGNVECIGIVARELRVRFVPPQPFVSYRYPALINAVAFTPDSKRILSAAGGSNEALPPCEDEMKTLEIQGLKRAGTTQRISSLRRGPGPLIMLEHMGVVGV